MKQAFDTKNIIKEIVESSTFRNKEVMKGLLMFLHEAYLQNKTLKEIDIACDYFNRDKHFIPGDDTIVRVNMFKLRNLLKNYYTEENKFGKISVSIPKGGYSLTFSALGKVKEKTTGKIRQILLFIALSLSIVINVIVFVVKSEKHQIDYHPVWQQYNNGSKPISIVLGNPFFYTQSNDDSNSVICRNLNINAQEELGIGGLNAERLAYPYFSANNVMPLPWIFNALKNTNSIELQAMTEINAEHIKNNNQIFISNINSFGIYHTFLEETSIRISRNPRQILLLRGKDTTKFMVPELHHEYFDDIAFLVKIPGSNDNIITMMGDFHAAGNTGIARMFQDKEKMKELNDYVLKRYERFPRYFEMIVKVSNYHQTDLKTTIVYFNEIEHIGLNTMLFPEMMN